MKNLRTHRIVMTILMAITTITMVALILTSSLICVYILGAIAFCMALCNLIFPISHRAVLKE